MTIPKPHWSVSVFGGIAITTAAAALIAWGALRATVTDHDQAIAVIRTTQVQDGREASALKADVAAIKAAVDQARSEQREDMRGLKDEIRAAMRGRR